MLIRLRASALKNTKWHEYLVRFVIGGAITVVTGWIGQVYGPTVGGLFLAFPAIFPASITLIQKHEHQRGERAGICKSFRALQAAALDARGAVIGSVGLAGFAFVVWKLALKLSNLATLGCALLAWAVLSTLLWQLRQRKRIV